MNPQGREFLAILKTWDSFFRAESEGGNDQESKEKSGAKEDFVNEVHTSHSLKQRPAYIHNQYLTSKGGSTVFILINNYSGSYHI